MEHQPQFKIMSEEKYEPTLEGKRPEDSTSPGDAAPCETEAQPGNLSPTQRHSLRRMLLALGVALIPSELEKGNLSDTSDTATYITDTESVVHGEAPLRSMVPPARPADFEGAYHSLDLMEAPERRIAGYQAIWMLPFNEVLFVDETNYPVGTVSLEEVYIEDRVNAAGEVFQYAIRSGYEPGNPTSITHGIPREWIQASRTTLQAEHSDVSIGISYNVIPYVRAALQKTSEPELLQGITEGTIITKAEIVEHFANKPVVGAEAFTRAEYVRENVVFDDDVPEIVQTELRRLLPGLCAQESGFDNSVTSRVGARGIFQFMPTTWSGNGDDPGLGMDPEQIHSLRAQVEAAGRYFSMIYRRLQAHIGAENWQLVRSWFSSDEAFEQYLVVPLMVNAYNAGSRRMADVVNTFIAAHGEVTAAPDSLALYFAIADFGRSQSEGVLAAYDVAAQQYFARVAAAAEVDFTNTTSP